MTIRADIARLLNEGLTNTAIAARCHVRHEVVAQARRELGGPVSKQGRRRTAATIEDAFRARTEPVEGGHLRWLGHIDRTGTPIVSLGRDYQTAYRVAFRIEHGREPVGKAMPGCDYSGCAAPGHVDDQPMREKNRKTYAAIFGGAS
jgi:hypothetical protein